MLLLLASLSVYILFIKDLSFHYKTNSNRKGKAKIKQIEYVLQMVTGF